VAGDDLTAAERLARVVRLAMAELGQGVGADWSCRAGVLDWTCRQTVEHLVDCLFSYALQPSARSPGPFLPLAELRALPEATKEDLLSALGGVGELLCRALEAAPGGPCAGDGLVQLDVDGWGRRGAFELLVHVHDVAGGLGAPFAPPAGMCSWVMASETLWMLDRDRAARAAVGRAAPGVGAAPDPASERRRGSPSRGLLALTWGDARVRPRPPGQGTRPPDTIWPGV